MMMTLDTSVTVTISRKLDCLETHIEAKLAFIDTKNIILGKELHPLPHTPNSDRFNTTEESDSMIKSCLTHRAGDGLD